MPSIQLVMDANERVIGLGGDAVEAARQAALSSASASQSESARDAAIAYLNPFASQAAGEAATSEGEPFSFIDANDEVALAVRTAGGSDLLPTYFSADKVSADGGATVQDALDNVENVAADTAQLQRLATTPDSIADILQRDGANIVVTGDSLSFNRYDFPGTTDTLNAWGQYPGIMSWSFMLRDFIYRADGNFVHADDLQAAGRLWFTSAASGTPAVTLASHRFPFNNRIVHLEAQSAASVHYIKVNRKGDADDKIVLYFLKSKTKDAIYDVWVTPTGGTRTKVHSDVRSGGATDFYGYDPYTLEIDPPSVSTDGEYLVEITNWREVGGGTLTSPRGQLWFCGAGSIKRNVYLTGRGSWTTADINADFAARIGSFNPDLLFVMTGANDRATKTKEQYAADLQTLIDAVYAVNPLCRIVGMTSNPASDTGWSRDETLNGSTMGEFVDAARAVYEANGAVFFDNFRLFEGIDPASWRVDNIHMTKEGNRILFEAVVNRFAPNIPRKNLLWYNPTQSVSVQQVPGEMLVDEHERARMIKHAKEAAVSGSRNAAGPFRVQKVFAAGAGAQNVLKITAGKASTVFDMAIRVTSSDLAATPAGTTALLLVNGRVNISGNILASVVNTLGGSITASFNLSGPTATLSVTPADGSDISILATADMFGGNGDFVLAEA